MYRKILFLCVLACSSVQASHDMPRAVAALVGSVVTAAKGSKFKEMIAMLPALSADDVVGDAIAHLESLAEDAEAQSLALYLRISTSTLPRAMVATDEGEYAKKAVCTLFADTSPLAHLLWAYGLLANKFGGECGQDDEEVAYTAAAQTLKDNDISMPGIPR